MKRLALALVLACGCTSPTGPRLGQEFSVRLHQQVALAGTPLTVVFDSILGDSRCPLGALCVWAGKAVIRVRVVTPASEHPVDLTTSPDSATGFVPLGYFITLLDLAPYPALDLGMAGRVDTVARLKLRQALD